MSDAAHSDSHGDAGMHHPHVVPARAFVGVLGALLVLTVLTVVVSWFDFEGFNMVIAMAIAALKASLVMAVFMHLRWDTAINNIVFLSSFLFVALLFLLTLADVGTRGMANTVHKQRAPVPDQFDPYGTGGH